MLFNSYEFLFIFLPIVFFGYFYLLSKRLVVGSKIWLTASSLVFYSWWNVFYLPLILMSIFFNFFIGSSLSKINKHDRTNSKTKVIKVSKKQLLIVGLVFNVALLAFFKYVDLLIESTNLFIGSEFELLNIIMPIGISFYTITQIAYIIDCYEGLAEEYDLLNYILFISFFPHLLIGPILHHKDMMPQFTNKWNWVKNYKNISVGLFLISAGLFKKVIIADSFSDIAYDGFQNPYSLDLINAWITSLSYTFQLYFDFSGYTDMAIGIALLFNIRMPINFNSPYKATSIIEFWQRWHITLTRFITTYIYSPIVRSFSKITFWKSMFALFTAMAIAGIWHGGTYNYLVFYIMHALALILNHLWRKFKFKFNKIMAWILTFNFVNISLVFFHANSLDTANQIIFTMFNLNNLPSLSIQLEFFILLIALAFVLLSKNTVYYSNNFKSSFGLLIFSIGFFISSFFVLAQPSEFIYFNF